mmetsp:Transcript_17447/g.48208  ORF Transcript_17447/g.48208 Transcript_17447/m.48208 type:complete len:204 (-) Transcript_17447:461-1072(-)
MGQLPQEPGQLLGARSSKTGSKQGCTFGIGRRPRLHHRELRRRPVPGTAECRECAGGGRERHLRFGALRGSNALRHLYRPGGRPLLLHRVPQHRQGKQGGDPAHAALPRAHARLRARRPGASTLSFYPQIFPLQSGLIESQRELVFVFFIHEFFDLVSMKYTAPHVFSYLPVRLAALRACTLDQRPGPFLILLAPEPMGFPPT